MCVCHVWTSFTRVWPFRNVCVRVYENASDQVHHFGGNAHWAAGIRSGRYESTHVTKLVHGLAPTNNSNFKIDTDCFLGLPNI